MLSMTDGLPNSTTNLRIQDAMIVPGSKMGIPFTFCSDRSLSSHTKCKNTLFFLNKEKGRKYSAHLYHKNHTLFSLRKNNSYPKEFFWHFIPIFAE